MTLPLERIRSQAALSANMIAKINGPAPAPASIDITWEQLRSAFLSSWTIDEQFDCREFSKRLSRIGINVKGRVR
jgi:hypothetical protein